jgi:hypothetical protein
VLKFKKIILLIQILIDIKNISDEEIIDECKRCIPIQAKLLEILKIWDMFAIKIKLHIF